MAKNITKRQTEILDFIKDMIRSHGYPPTRREITDQFGFGSPNAAEEHLRALDRKGYINLRRHTSRGITVSGFPQPRENTFGEEVVSIVGLVAAGSPIEYFEDYQSCNVPPNLFSPPADYMLRVQGESMINAGIFHDDLLAVHKTSQVRSGQIVVARIENEVTVKRYRESADPNRIRLEPENDNYRTIEVDLRTDADTFTIEGISVGVLRLSP